MGERVQDIVCVCVCVCVYAMWDRCRLCACVCEGKSGLLAFLFLWSISQI